MVSVTSCADYDEDINALQNQVNNLGSVQKTLQSQLDGMSAQIAALKGSLDAMKSCQCGDIDKKIADQLAKTLASYNYVTPADVTEAVNKALAELNMGPSQEEIEALIKKYHDAHPACSCGDIETLVKKYLSENPGLSESDVEKIVKAYHDAHPSSTLTENDVKSIVETYINQVQPYTKEEVEAIISTSVTQAIANYVEKTEILTKSQIEELISSAVDKLQPGISQDKVQELIDEALKDVKSGLSETEVNALIEEALKDVTPGLTTEDVQALIDAAKCECNSLTSVDVTTIATTVIENYMKEHPYSVDPEVIESICNTVVNNSQVINNIQNSITTLETSLNNVTNDLNSLKDNVYTKTEIENVVNVLIQTALNEINPGSALSAAQQAAVNSLIITAINDYHATHPTTDCTCDAQAFQKLVEDVAAHADAIKNIPTDYVTSEQLEKAIKGIKDIIPAEADLSNYVTVATYNADMVNVNNAIAAAQSKAEEALAKAQDNATDITNLQTTVENLSTLYNGLSSQVEKLINKVENAQSRALSNYYEIITLSNVYNQLKNRVDFLEANPYDDIELRNRIEELENNWSSLATDEELENNINEVKELITQARTYAETVANQAAASALESAKEYAKNYADGKYQEAQDYANEKYEAAKTYADGIYENAKDYVDSEIIKVKDYANSEFAKIRVDFAEADKVLQDQIDALTTRVEKVESDIEEIQEAVEVLNNKVDALSKFINNIELQGSVNPAFGYFALPMGITSNVLISYYGETDYDVHFPAIEDEGLVYKEGKNWITEEDAIRLGWNKPYILTYNGGSMLMNEDGNAGKLYLTLNPSNIDFTGTTLKLVNSLGEESPVKLGALKKSTDKLVFGQSRGTATQTYFYEAPATLDESKVGKAAFHINNQLTDALEDVAKNKLKADISTLAQSIYNQFNGVLDAYAVQATWNDALGEHTVTSNYGIAATAAKPLSYSFLVGKSFEIPTITPLSEHNIDLNDYIKLPKFDFTFNGIDTSQYSEGFKVKVHFSDVWISKEPKTDKNGVLHAAGSIWTNVYMEEYVKSDGDIEKAPEHMVEGEFCLVDADGTFNGPVYEGGNKPSIDPTVLNAAQVEAINAMIALLVEDRSQVWSAQLQNGLQNQVVDKLASLVDDINKMITEVSENLEGNLSGKLQDMIDNANNKLNSALGKGDRFINQINKLINNVNSLIANPNARLQSVVLYEDGNGTLHPMSTAKAMPTYVSGDGAALELKLTSYSGEILAPAFKKFVAVTNVYRGSETADTNADLMKALNYANSKLNFNEVIDGDHYAVAFCPDKSVKGATYEIVYSALDFHGKISQRKYYVTVK